MKQLPITEKENYTKFHRFAYKDDLKHAELTYSEFPRWSIISGYYCMHDITKLFLAEKYNIKITSPEIHAKAIDALAKCLTDKMLKDKLIELLKQAENFYYSVERLKEKTLLTLLKRGKQERGKAQYYSEDFSKHANSEKALYFIENIVRPYVNLIEELMK